MKKNYREIKTLAHLQKQIQLLKADYKAKEMMLKEDSKTYIKQFSIFNMIKKYATPNSFIKLDEKTNISSKIMSVLLPMILNSTVFRKSGLITKALGALVSGNLGKSLDAESLSGIFNFVKSLFNVKKKETSADKYVDYGIPPDSETF